MLLRGSSVKNNLSHTGHCVVADQGWEKLRLERGGLALHSYRFHFWFECVSKGVASPIMHRNRRCPSLLYFHGSCRENRGHMFQNHNLARLKAGLRSTLWWNMWLSCIACMMVSKWNLADRDGLISFQDRVFTSPFPFCKRWSGSIGLFFADGRGEAHISCLLLWPRVPERNRDRQDKEIASLGILAKRFSFFVKKGFSFIQTGEVLSSFIFSWSFFFSFYTNREI